jgi:hypothetical protein
VREVSIEDDQDGSGVPQYFAIIDYFITVRSKAEASRIQVRKAFQTQNLLQQGFANVELLVLPEEPTSSVLKEDWEREVAAQEQTEEDIISIGGFGDMSAVVTASINGKTSGAACGRASEKKPVATLSRVDIWAKRASLVLSACLVTLSLIGAVNAVHRIPSERVATLGWISVTVGSVFLWPLAMLCLKIMAACQRILRLPTEKSGTGPIKRSIRRFGLPSRFSPLSAPPGIILNCDTNAQLEDTINEEKMYTQYLGGKAGSLGNIQMRHVDKVTYSELFEALKRPSQQEFQELIEQEEAKMPNPQRHLLTSTSADESARYFVRLPGHTGPDGQGSAPLEAPSMSTISANSQYSKDNRKSLSST